jgi:hypothetical protein
VVDPPLQCQHPPHSSSHSNTILVLFPKEVTTKIGCRFWHIILLQKCKKKHIKNHVFWYLSIEKLAKKIVKSKFLKNYKKLMCFIYMHFDNLFNILFEIVFDILFDSVFNKLIDIFLTHILAYCWHFFWMLFNIPLIYAIIGNMKIWMLIFII